MRSAVPFIGAGREVYCGVEDIQGVRNSILYPLVIDDNSLSLPTCSITAHGKREKEG